MTLNEWIYAIRKKLQQKLHCMTYHFARRKYAFTYLSSSSMAFVQSSMASVSFSIWQSTQTVTVLRTHFSWFCCISCVAVCHMQWQTNWWTELVIKCLPMSITLVLLCINNFAVFNTSCLGCVKKTTRPDFVQRYPDPKVRSEESWIPSDLNGRQLTALAECWPIPNRASILLLCFFVHCI